ncbi:MAG: SIS domain-containing protein [Verrucomicrobiales bacterium]|nr:SIS domain-containing protein [Verrucomicrobiales bacterium]
MNVIDRYLRTVLEQLRHAADSQRTGLEHAASVLASALLDGRYLYVFGTGHSHMLAEEVFYRAGGLARAAAILDPPLMLHQSAADSSRLEQESGRAQELLDRYPVRAGDVLIVASNSGRNAVPIELTLAARERGLRTIALTSLAHSRAFPSRHASGKRLFEVAEMVLDHGSPIGDAALDLPGLPRKFGPTSSIAGLFLVNALVARAIELATHAGHPPEIYASSNADVPGWNEALLAQYRGQVRHL